MLENLAKLGRVAKFTLKSNSPKIKVVGGVALGVFGVVAACKATLDVQPIIDTLKDEEAENKAVFDENGDKKELRKSQTASALKAAKGVGKKYLIPAAALGGSVALIASGFGELNTRYLGAVSAAGMFKGELDQYRKKVAGEIGVDKEKDLYHGVAYKDIEISKEGDDKVKKLKKAPVYENDMPLGPLTVDFCERSADGSEGSTYYNSQRNDLNLLFLKNAQLRANDQLKVDGFMTVYTLLTDFLGMSPQCLQVPSMALNWGWKYTYDDSDPTSDNYIDLGVWDAYWNLKNDDAVDFARFGQKAIWLDLNAVPLFGIDEKKENKLTSILGKGV